MSAAPLPAVASLDGQVTIASWPSRFMTKWQAPLFFPLMVLRSTGIYVLGIQRLVRQRDRAAFLEGALLGMHASLYLACVFWVLSPLKAVAFIAIQQAVFSVYLGCSFAPNHKGMPLVDPELRTELRPAPGHHLPQRGRRLVHQRGAGRPQFPD